MKKIVLYGELGRKFGKYWYLDVKTPAEAIHAIAVNKPGILKYLLDEHEKNKSYGFKVFCGKENRDLEGLTFPVSSKEVIRIVPVITGAGGVAGIVVGAILVVVGGYTGQAWLAAYGWSMIIGGAASLLVQSMAKKNKPGEDNGRSENRPSFTFSGAVNVIAPGGCVPVCYGGPIEVGSYVISGGIDARDIPIS